MPSPDPDLRTSRIVVFDTETTGLSPADDHVLEIAALALENGVETGRFESLIDPGVPIPPALTAIHGITDEMVRGRPPFAEVAAGFLEFAGDAILAAHNAVYDVSMLIVPMRAAGLAPRGNPVLDTCRLARRLVASPSYKLTVLAKTLGIPMPTAHRAMADVEACTALFRVLLDRLGEGATLGAADRICRSRLDFGPGPRLFPPLPPRLAALEEGLRAGSRVEIVYRGGSHGEVPRAITPLFLVELDGSLDVAAQCHLEPMLKNFRLDRIAAARRVG